jgi:hypothetical protein
VTSVSTRRTIPAGRKVTILALRARSHGIDPESA